MKHKSCEIGGMIAVSVVMLGIIGGFAWALTKLLQHFAG